MCRLPPRRRLPIALSRVSSGILNRQEGAMRKFILGFGFVLCAAAFGAPTSARAARATECTVLNICYCVEQDLKGAIDANVSKARQAIAEQKSSGKAVGYLSLPLS